MDKSLSPRGQASGPVPLSRLQLLIRTLVPFPTGQSEKSLLDTTASPGHLSRHLELNLEVTASKHCPLPAPLPRPLCPRGKQSKPSAFPTCSRPRSLFFLHSTDHHWGRGREERVTVREAAEGTGQAGGRDGRRLRESAAPATPRRALGAFLPRASRPEPPRAVPEGHISTVAEPHHVPMPVWREPLLLITVTAAGLQGDLFCPCGAAFHAEENLALEGPSQPCAHHRPCTEHPENPLGPRQAGTCPAHEGGDGGSRTCPSISPSDKGIPAHFGS